MSKKAHKKVVIDDDDKYFSNQNKWLPQSQTDDFFPSLD